MNYGMDETDSTILKKRIISGTLWLTGLTFTGQAFTWIVSIFVIRLLKPEDYGLMAMAGFFVGILTLWKELGLSPAVIQKKDITENELKRVYGCVILLNILFVAGIFLLAPLAALFFSEPRVVPILRTLSVNFPLTALFFLPQALLKRDLEFKKKSFIDLLASVFSSFVLLVLAYLGYGVWALVFSVVSLNLFKALAFNTLREYCYWPSFNLAGMRHFFAFGGHITATRTLWRLYSQADILIAGRILGKDILGIYAIAMRVASLPIDKLSSIFTQVGLSAFAKIQSDHKTIQTSFLRLIKVTNIFSFPLFIGLALVAADLIPLVLGDRWLAVISPLQILCIIMPLRFVAILYPPIVTGTGHPEVITKNMLIAIVIMPAAFLIGSHWGLMGICYAWLTAFPALFLIMTSRVLNILEIGKKKFLTTFVKPVIACLTMTLILLILKWYAGGILSAPLVLSLELVCGGASYLVVLISLDKTVIAEIKSFFRNR